MLHVYKEHRSYYTQMSSSHIGLAASLRDEITRVVTGVVENLKVHKHENFLGFDFEICTFS